MKITRKQINKGFTLVELLVVIAIIAALAAMATPVIMKQKKKADMITATSNAKQIFLLMVEFDGDMGEFPSETTASKDDDFQGLSTSSSNGLLGQFIAGGYVQSEEIFYAKGGSKTGGRPDNDISSNSKILEKGECGFAYITGLSGSDNAGIPLLCAPMPDTAEEYDPDPYGGKGLVLSLDGSVKTYRLNKQNKAKLPSGETVFGTKVWTDATSDNSDLKIVLAE